MQQPAQSSNIPAMPAPGGFVAHPGLLVSAGFDASELDLGYEGAFPFLTENDGSDA